MQAKAASVEVIRVLLQVGTAALHGTARRCTALHGTARHFLTPTLPHPTPSPPHPTPPLPHPHPFLIGGHSTQSTLRLQSNADATIRCNDGLTPLDLARLNPHQDAINALS